MKSDVSVVSASERSAGHIHEREPSKGRMCGTCHALKNLSQSVQLIVDAVGTGRIKQRWYVLDGRALSWYKDEESLEESLGTLDMSDVLGIRHVSSEMRLHSDYVHSFAIETEGRVFALSCPSEDEKNDWLVALQVAFDSASLRNSSYRLQPKRLRPEDIPQYRDKLKDLFKQFENIAVEDRTEALLSRTVDSTDALALASYIMLDLESYGLSHCFLQLLQELVLIPSDGCFAEAIWSLLIGCCRYIRSGLLEELNQAHRAEGGDSGMSVTVEQLLHPNIRSLLSGVFGSKTIRAVLEEGLRRRRGGGLVEDNVVTAKSISLTDVSKQVDVTRLRIQLEAKDLEIARLKRERGQSTGKVGEGGVHKEGESFGDDPVAGAAPPPAAPADPKLAKYHKMKSMFPDPVVRQRMQLDGLTAQDIDLFFSQPSPVPHVSGTPEPAVESKTHDYDTDPRYLKFVKLLGTMPDLAIRLKMKKELFQPEEIDAFFKSVMSVSVSTSSPSAMSKSASSPTPAPSTLLEKFSKYDKMKAMLPEAALRQRMARDGVSEADINRYVSHSAVEVSREGGDENAYRALGLPPKPKQTPGKKMRGLFWTRLGPKEVQGTVWQDVVPNLQLTVSDREELEKAFGATATSTSHLSPIKDVEGERAKTQPLALLDAKRTQGILIVLGKLRM
eukprot:gene6229-7963_t